MGFRRAMIMTSNYVRSVIQNFVNYTAVFNAWYEADYCLERSLDDLNRKDLLYNASLIVTPNSYKEGLLYNVFPKVKNILINSGYFNLSPWTAGGATITPNAGTAPDGTLTAYLYNDTGASGTLGVIIQAFTATSNILTCSIYLKASATTNDRRLALRNGTTATIFDTLIINLNTGVFTGAGWTVVALSNGWYRCIYTRSTDFSIGNTMQFYTARTSAAPVGATDQWFAWGAQVEEGYNVSTYSQTYASIIPTFTRASTATRLNSSGNVEVVPSQNLISQSETFNSATWQKVNTTITADSAIAPNGTLTADTYGGILAVGQTRLFIAGLTSPVGINTLSLYVKANDYNGLFAIRGDAVTATATASFTFSGTTLSFTSLQIGNSISYTLTSLANGWYRISLTYNNLATFFPDITTFNPGTTGSFYIWGAQLTTTSTVQTYFPTTTRFNIPRANYLVGDTCPTLLLEPQRSNLYLNSATLITQTNVVTTATAYTVSFYGIGTITFTGAYIGSLVGTGTNNLVSLTFTTTTTSLISTVTGSVTNAQLEAGSFPTSYIPTTTTLVTRIIDALTVLTPYTSNLITSLGGTLLLDLKDVKSLIRQGTGNGIYIGDSTINTSNCFVIRGNNTIATFPLILKYVAGTVSTLYTLNAASSKIVIKWDGTYINIFINGTQVVTNSAFTTTNMNNFVSNTEFVTNIKTMALYPLPLTDAQCLSLSTQ